MQIASIASAYDERGGDVDTLASAALIRGSVIVFLMLGVIALSTFFFAGQSLRLDEAQSLWQTSRSPLAMFQVVAQDVHVPLYHLMLHYWQVYLGNGVATARVLSLIFFVMMIPAIYVLGARAYSPPVGLFAAILTAASPFLNWYGNEIRMYSLFAFVTTVNQYYFLSLFAGSRRPDNTVKRSVWLMYGFSLIIGLCTHYFFSFNAAAQALFYFTHKGRFPRRALRNFIIIGCITLAIFTPWILFVINQGSAANTQPLLAKPTTIDLFNTFSQFMFGFQSDHINTILISLWPLLVLLIFLSLRRNQQIAPKTVYLFMSLFVPIILAFTLSDAIKPIYLSRYLILSLPALYVLVSWILSLYPARLANMLKIGLTAAMILMLSVEISSAATPVKEDYRAASDYVTAHASPEDVIVLSAPFTVYPFEYYYRGPDSIQTLPLWDRYATGPIPAFSETELTADVQTIKDSHQTLWLLLSYDQGYEQAIRMYFDTHYERTDNVNFSPGLNLYAYKLRYDQHPLSAVLRRLNTDNSSSTLSIR